MFNKLRSNYNLSNVLVRIFFVLAVMLSTWRNMLGTLNYLYVGAMQDYITQLNGASKLFIALASSALAGVILMFITPFLTGLFLNVSKIYSVPRAEYCLLVNMFCAIGFFVNGLLDLINLITPVFMVWGGVIFPFVITLGCFVAFYLVTSKMYFNVMTKVHYFKCLLIVALVVLFLEVVL